MRSVVTVISDHILDMNKVVIQKFDRILVMNFINIWRFRFSIIRFSLH